MTGALGFGLLGELEVTIGGERVPLGAGKLRVVLATLLLRANHTVSADELIDRLWGNDPPRAARATMQAYVMRLRQALDDGGRKSRLIHTQPAGYRIEISPEQVDLCRFRGLVDEANELASAAGAEKLREALSLWRGEPLGDIPSESLRRDVVPGLIEERLRVVERRIELELELGRHDELIGELTTLTTDHPLREQLRSQLMLALFRSGRQAEALESYREIRDLLVSELGVDPGPELRALHGRILRGDPALAAPSVERHGGRNDLPGDIADFTGREQEMTRLVATLSNDDTKPGAVVITAIDGMAGIGKTTLAIHAAHHLTPRYPDAQLFLDLHGHTPGRVPIEPLSALDTLLRAVGVPGDQIPHDLDERAALWRAELADRNMVLVLDNAATTTQIRALLPGTAGCLTLITSRRRLVDLEAAQVLSLDVLPRADGIALFARIVDDERTLTQAAAVDEVVALCGDLPLAIRIAAARLRSRPTWTVTELAGRLRDGHRRLTELTAGDRGVAAAFSVSYQHLTSEQQRMFRLLGLHPGPDIDTYAAACLTNTDLDIAEQLLEELLDVHLLQQSASGRYRFHDLLRHHAHQTVSDTEPSADQHEARTRLLDYYLHTAVTADRLLYPHREPIQLDDLATGCHPHPLDDQTAVWAWFTAEHSNLLASHHLAVELGWHAVVWQLAWALSTFHYWRGHFHDDLAVWRAGLTAAQQADDPATQTLAHRYLGHASADVGLHAEGLRHLQQALTLADHTGDTHVRAHTHRELAWAWGQRGEDQRALEHATHALRLYRTLDTPVREAYALNQVGWYQAQLGHHEQARTHCETALTLHRRHHNRDGEATTLDSLGYLAHHTAHHTDALIYYQQALTLRRDLGHPAGEADTLDRLGQTHHALGQPDQARTAWRQALQLYQTQHRTTDADRIQQQLDALDDSPSDPGRDGSIP